MEKNKKVNLRKEKAIQTKNALFAAAIELFKEKGYHNVTVDEIAKRAGTAKGTFYIYFENKSKVIVEEFIKIDLYYEKVYPQLENCKTATEKISLFTKKQLTFIKNLGLDMLRVLYLNQIEKNPDNTDKILINEERKLFTVMSELIKSGIESGEFKNSSSVAELTDWFNRSIRGLVLDWIIAEGEYNLVAQGLKYAENFLVVSLKHQAG